MQYYYESQGVKFSAGLGKSILKDATILAKLTKEEPGAFPVTKILKTLYGEKLAPICGLTSIKGGVRLFVTDPVLVGKIFCDYTQYHTKHWSERSKVFFVTPGSIIAAATETPNYHANRKALSSAFLKNKMLAMVSTIKDCTL